MCVSGLYTIKNKINNNIYVGITDNIHIRWKHHKSNLIKGYANRHSDHFIQNKPRVRHHQLYLQKEFNKFYSEYGDKIWDGVYEFELILPVSQEFYDKKSLSKIEDVYILKLRETSEGYFQMTSTELGNKYKIIDVNGQNKITSELEENKDTVINDYLVVKLSYKQIGDKFNVSVSSVMRLLQKYEVDARNHSSCKLKFDICDYKNEIISMYLNKSLTASEIAKKLNTTCGTINTHLKTWGVNLKTLAELVSGIDLNKHKEQVMDMYINQNKSMLKIGKHFGVSKTTIKKYLKLWGVRIKSQPEYSKQNVLQTT
jgi:predicted DNA-binding protein YlxM (UPF0122 family)